MCHRQQEAIHFLGLNSDDALAYCLLVHLFELATASTINSNNSIPKVHRSYFLSRKVFFAKILLVCIRQSFTLPEFYAIW